MQIYVFQYHIACLELNQVPRKWVCDALCIFSRKVARRCQISLLGMVPDYIFEPSLPHPSRVIFPKRVTPSRTSMTVDLFARLNRILSQSVGGLLWALARLSGKCKSSSHLSSSTELVSTIFTQFSLVYEPRPAMAKCESNWIIVTRPWNFILSFGVVHVSCAAGPWGSLLALAWRDISKLSPVGLITRRILPPINQ